MRIIGPTRARLDTGIKTMINAGTSISNVIDLRDADGGPSRAFVLQLQVVQNHQNGRDTHIRQMRIIGPTRARLDTGIKTMINAGTSISNVPLKFTSQTIAQFANIR
ncbi:hypothetical protein WUBG_17358 [Wuchereria bancrofti]|uniref:Anaphase-promoting complex subunit 10 n=1 Tax=Wuchereria bancrofti TaxID=6293 RepID=J9DQA8_WUCBA|nr:hypothetical protein WUBG_17358 [Wuchereria bancrofti]